MLIFSKSPEETISLGKKISKFLKKGSIICLSGELGSGKTTFVKGVALGLGIKKDKINSPTFVMLKEYKGRLNLYHFDFYRIKNLKEIMDLGCQEFIFNKGISIIEWSEKISKILPDNYLEIKFYHKSDNTRSIKLLPHGRFFEDLLKRI